MTQTITIGRRTFNTDRFIDAVKKSKRYTEICDNLGINNTVATTKTAIKEVITALGIDTSHFEYKYNKSENYDKGVQARIKSFTINPVNQAYYNAIEQKFADKPQSWLTYKATVGNFLEGLRDRDFATITAQEIEDYCGAKQNSLMHIRSMLITAVKENVNNAVDKVSKEMLIWLI
jgi:hypothetical protein